MAKIAYMVIATLPSEEVAVEYIAWLKDGHVDAVVASGATSGEVIRIESGQPDVPPRVVSRYEFESREAFDRYERESAPALRAEGVAKFGAGRVISFQRLVGEVL